MIPGVALIDVSNAREISRKRKNAIRKIRLIESNTQKIECNFATSSL